jgi:signal-transduction protein with cAMP-binding, CBS, and nucleotidyltransferase domain
MYNNYEKKLMSIPKICEKDYRASDEKYFVGLYLQQNPLFSKLPQVVFELLLAKIKTKYVKVGETVHPGGPPSFMGILFAGVVTIKRERETVVCEKNSVIMGSAFDGHSHEPILCREEAIILALEVKLYDTLVTRLR